MFTKLNKIVLFFAISIHGLNTFAQEIKPEAQSLFIEEQLNKIKAAASPANIHINVDAKSYINNFNSNNTSTKKTRTEKNSNKIEIKDNTESTITSEVSKDKKSDSENTTIAPISNLASDEKLIAPVIDNSKIEAQPPVAELATKSESEKLEVQAIEPVKAPEDISVEESFIDEAVLDAVVVEPAVASPSEAPTITPVEMSPEIIIVEPAQSEEQILKESPTEVIAIAKSAEVTSSSPFSIRGFYNFGKFTSISDISSNYSLGMSLGYDLNPDMRIDFQYAFSKYEDTYDYSYSALVSGYKFDQHDFAVILNYKIIKDQDFNIYARGGLNYSYRKAYDFYSGYTNSSNSLGAVLGVGADYKVAKNLAITSNLDYILSLTSSGGNDIASPLYLVENENFLNISFGLKFEF
jgi:outer membrane protein W